MKLQKKIEICKQKISSDTSESIDENFNMLKDKRGFMKDLRAKTHVYTWSYHGHYIYESLSPVDFQVRA